MTFISAFDVIGPNMIGPSSSHTAGAVSIALLAKNMLPGIIKKADFTLFGSFAKTYQGHGTDRALLGGVMGFAPDDLRIKHSFQIADQQGLLYSFQINEREKDVYPNTVDICIENDEGTVLKVRGESVGGGKIKIVRINHVKVEFTGEYSTLIVIHKDRPGLVAHIAKCLSEGNVNIAFMRLYREEKGACAYSIVESDEKIPQMVLDRIRENSCVQDIMLVQI